MNECFRVGAGGERREKGDKEAQEGDMDKSEHEGDMDKEDKEGQESMEKKQKK
jgi:hypothetical protein